jgi:hypothetical protein
VIQDIAVFAIVGLAVIYTAWKLMPRVQRARIVQATVVWAQRHGRFSDQEAAAIARRLTPGGCSLCDSCGTCGSAAPAVASDASVLRFVSGESRATRT